MPTKASNGYYPNDNLIKVWTEIDLYSSFPLIHKVDNVAIFVQLQIEINWKEVFKCRFTLIMLLWIKAYSNNNCI